MRIPLTLFVASFDPSAGAFVCSHQASFRALFKAGLPPNAPMLENPGDTDVLNYNLSVEAKPSTSEILALTSLRLRAKSMD
jgi:hypothetical protein